jgi:hypothetical protein
MSQITITQLESLINDVNKFTNSPQFYFDKDDKINIGHYHLYIANGSYSLHKTVNDGSGVTEVLYGETKKELYIQIKALIAGIFLGANLNNPLRNY